MTSVVDVTTADFVAGSGNVGCWHGEAFGVATPSHPDKQAAASGTKRVIVCGEVYQARPRRLTVMEPRHVKGNPRIGDSFSTLQGYRTSIQTGTEVDTETVSRRIRQDFPHLTIARIVYLGEGLGNIAFEVNDTHVFRLPKSHVNIVDLQRELLILPVVRTHSTLPVPQPEFVPSNRSYVGYRKLPGRILMNAAAAISMTGCVAIGRQLGAFLSSIHEIPAAAFDPSTVRRESLWPEDCLASARDDYAKAKKGIPTRYVPAVERFLDASPVAEAWSGDSVFAHNDLGTEHILVQNGVVSGVIDWRDTAFTDPAYDFGLLYRDLGPTVLEASLEGYAGVHSADKEQIRQRAQFYGRWRVLENIAYGLEPQHAAYLDAAIRSLTWLFPDSA